MFATKSQSFRWSVTFHHAQVYVEFVVIEPSWDLHSAAVYAGISPLSVNDGQGHVSVRHPPLQLVPGGLPVDHGPILGGQDGVGTFGHGHLPPSPAETLDAVSLGVIAAGQSHIVPEATEDFDGAWRHCGGERWTSFKNRMTQSAVVFLKNKVHKCSHPPAQKHQRFHAHSFFTNRGKQNSRYWLTVGHDREDYEKITKTTHVCRLLYNDDLKSG